MKNTFNKVHLKGYIFGEPEVIRTDKREILIAVTLETFELEDEDGEWHCLIFFGSNAKFGAQLKSGQLIEVKGKLRTNRWKDSSGDFRQVFKIWVDEVQEHISV